MPVLSGTAFVGQLYDGSRDQIIEGFSLWKNDQIVESNVLSTSSDSSMEENIKTRLDSMDITASLKLSFLGGLISVSLKYLILPLSSLFCWTDNERKDPIFFIWESSADI